MARVTAAVGGAGAVAVAGAVEGAAEVGECLLSRLMALQAAVWALVGWLSRERPAVHWAAASERLLHFWPPLQPLGGRGMLSGAAAARSCLLPVQRF